MFCVHRKLLINRSIKCNVCITILWKIPLISIAFPAYLSCVIFEPNFRVCITLELTIFFFGIFANDNDFDKIPQGIFQLQNFPFYTTWFTYLTASCQKR